MPRLAALTFGLAATAASAVRTSLLSEEEAVLSANGTNAGALAPEQGGCAAHAVDTWQSAHDSVCHVRLYKCSDHESVFPVKNSNTGDVAWALTKKCRSYGKYLHMWKVDVALVSMTHGKSGYAQCNRHSEYGILCGCGLKVEDEEKLKKKCPPPEPWLHTARVFGWRNKDYELGQVYQFSTPYKAMGDVDPKAAKALVNSKHHTRHDPEDGDAPFQWKEVEHERAIDIDKCLEKNVLRGGGSPEEVFERFRAAVIDGTAPGCEDITASAKKEPSNTPEPQEEPSSTPEPQGEQDEPSSTPEPQEEPSSTQAQQEVQEEPSSTPEPQEKPSSTPAPQEEPSSTPEEAGATAQPQQGASSTPPAQQETTSTAPARQEPVTTTPAPRKPSSTTRETSTTTLAQEEGPSTTAQAQQQSTTATTTAAAFAARPALLLAVQLALCSALA